MNKLGYKSEVYKVDSSNIDEFDFLQNKRRCRENKVTKLKNLILSGDHFDSPIVVNQNGKKRIIDGQHRIYAIKKAITEYPDFEIEVLLTIYNNLDKAGERSIFTRWNIGTKQSSDDFIQMYESEIPILGRMKADFPVEVAVYRQSGKLHFKLLTGSYVAAKIKRQGGYTGSNDTFVDQIKNLDNSDYVIMKKFVEEFVYHIGLFEKTNLYTNTTPFSALMYLYLHNVANGKVSSLDFWNRFKQKVMVDPNITQMSLAGGTQPTKIVTGLMMLAMNNVPPIKKQLALPYSEEVTKEEEDVED